MRTRRLTRVLLATLLLGGMLGAGGPAAAAVGPSARTLDQAIDRGWNCDPLILLGGHYHCSPPGRPGVADIIAGTDVASITHQVFHADGTFAGTELLIRADLFAGQPCPTDAWLPVPAPEFVQYWACHRFDF